MSSSLPPSRPSHPRRRTKPPSDPFLALPLTPPPTPPSDEPSQTQHQRTTSPSAHLARLVLTPLYMTSFLLSLLLTNFLSRRARVRSSTSTSDAPTLFAPSSWFAAEPYQPHQQHPVGSTPHQNPDSTWGTTARNTARNDGGGRWFLRKKHRAIAKLEISDALALRGVVMGLLVGAVGVGVVGGFWVFRGLIGG